ncbi:MAG: MBL fold metallo-hydrolase [Candidatus Omnitrophica bacterium]|nr:MBL fold metallo-hydrolase [Candidatus Omnitrophota bacterium]MDD5487435.1 MBL fold metallo-hydrolase [Candidatus Omnitrophota bacterium]
MSRIKVTILGTTAGVPTPQRAHASIFISYDDGNEVPMLFDCGEGTQRQMMSAGINMMKLDDIFITHWHGDHCLGLAGLVDTMGFEGRTKELHIHCPEARKGRRLIKRSYSMGKVRVVLDNLRSSGSRIDKVFENDRFVVVSVPVRHSIPAVAFGIFEKDKVCVSVEKARQAGLPEEGKFYSELKEKGETYLDGRRVCLEEISTVKKGRRIVYSGDTEICDNLKALAAGADLLIQDCTYFSNDITEKNYKHAALPEVLEMIKAEKVKRTVLTHIGRKYSDPAALEKMLEGAANVSVAYDMMELVV